MVAKAKRAIRDTLNLRLNKVNSQLGELNRELAAQMIKLAAQTGDTTSLIEAVQALKKAKTYYQFENAPAESMEVQQALADTLLSLGKKANDKEALSSAIQAYRNAITLASLIGDEGRRSELKSNYKATQKLLGSHQETQSLFKVA